MVNDIENIINDSINLKLNLLKDKNLINCIESSVSHIVNIYITGGKVLYSVLSSGFF